MQINATFSYSITAGGSDDANVYLSEAERHDLSITYFGDIDHMQVQTLVEQLYSDVNVSVCHACAKNISDPELDEINYVTFEVDGDEFSYMLSAAGVWERDHS